MDCQNKFTGMWDDRHVRHMTIIENRFCPGIWMSFTQWGVLPEVWVFSLKVEKVDFSLKIGKMGFPIILGNIRFYP